MNNNDNNQYNLIKSLLSCFPSLRALADMNNDGKMDMHEFSIAMKLIKLKLQGHPLPPSLPPSMKQPPLTLPPPPTAPFGKGLDRGRVCLNSLKGLIFLHL